MKRQGQLIYNSKKWQRVRKAYLESKNYICERCGKPATIVHHKTHLTAANVTNGAIAYDFENLEALCQDCHNAEHEHFEKIGAVFTASGNVVDYHENQNTREFSAAKSIIEQMNFNPPHLPTK